MEFPPRLRNTPSSYSFNECLPRRRIIATNPEQAEHKNNSSPGQQGRPLPHCWYVFSRLSLSLSPLFLRAYTLYARSGVPRCMWVKLTMHGTRLAGTKDVRFLKYCHRKAISARRPTEDFPDGRRSFGWPLCWGKGERREEREKEKGPRRSINARCLYVARGKFFWGPSNPFRGCVLCLLGIIYWVNEWTWAFIGVKLVNGKVDLFLFCIRKIVVWSIDR